jgi:hypothetical protein
MGEELVLTLDASRGPPDSTPPQGEGVSSSRGMRRISRRDGFTDYLLMLDKLDKPLPGRPGWLPTQAPHRPVRAELPHTVPQVTVSLRAFRPHDRSSGWVADNASGEG